jgi:hypothetical protein
MAHLLGKALAQVPDEHAAIRQVARRIVALARLGVSGAACL